MSEKFDPFYTWLGIPPEEQPADYYRLLGIRRFENNPEVISNALGQRQAHLRSLDSGERAAVAQEVLRELALAGECLASSDKKGAYDRGLRQKDAPKLSRASAAPQVSKPTGLHKSTTNISVAVTQTTTVASAPSAAPPSKALSASLPWPPLAILAAVVAGILLVGGVVLVASLLAAGLFMNRPVSGPTVAGKPGNPVPPALPPIQSSIPPQFPANVLSTPPSEASTPSAEKPADPLPAVENLALAPIQAELGPPLDLLKSFQSQQVERGEVHRNQDGSWRTAGSAQDMLVFRVEHLPPEYVVDTTVIRIGDTANGSLLQGLVTPGGQCLVVVDGFKASGVRTVVANIDGKPAGSLKDACEYRGQLLPGRAGVNLKYFVFKDRLAVECNGKTILDWTGGLHRLSLDGQFRVGDPRALFFGAMNGSFMLTRFEVRSLRPLGAPPPEAIAANDPPTPPSSPDHPAPLDPKKTTPAPGPGETVEPTSEPAPQETRLAVPSEAAWQEKLKLIRQIYQPGIKLADKANAAERLIQDAEGEPDPASTYSLLLEARRLKLEVGDIHGAFAVCDSLIAKFALDPWQVQLETLQQAPKWADAPLERKALAEHTRRIAEGALAAAQFAVARDAAEVAEKLGDTSLKKDAHEWKAAAERALEQEVAFATGLQTLKVQPDDVEANAVCGRFLCLMKRDWARGLPHLAKASNVAVKIAAAHDLTVPATPEQQLALGDEWWQLADSLPAGRESDSLRLRARHWYEQGLPSVTGLARAQAARRIEETDKLAGEDAATHGPVVDVLPDPRRLTGYRGKTGKVFYFDIVGSGRSGSLYGTNIYTDDSSLSKAAVHAGVLKDGQAGVVKVTILPGRPSYVSSTRNGVTSSGWDAYPGSFKVEPGPRVGIRRLSDAEQKAKAEQDRKGKAGADPPVKRPRPTGKS